MAPVYELRGVDKRLGDVRVLDGIDLRVEAGETVVVVGQTGCGKSTLLRLLVGLLVPDSGAVLFEGEPLTAERLAAARRRMGYVIQDGGLFPHLTGHENLTLMARQLHWPAERIAARVAELSELTRFPPGALQRFPAELSGGQRQRVALMRALMLDPDALLLDEPLGALDPMVRFELQEELKELFRTLGKAAVIVTHDLHEADYLADRIVLLHQGRIMQTGRLEDFLTRPAAAFVTRFLQAQRSLAD